MPPVFSLMRSLSCVERGTGGVVGKGSEGLSRRFSGECLKRPWNTGPDFNIQNPKGAFLKRIWLFGTSKTPPPKWVIFPWKHLQQKTLDRISDQGIPDFIHKTLCLPFPEGHSNPVQAGLLTFPPLNGLPTPG
jgi:hypothetical protein